MELTFAIWHGGRPRGATMAELERYGILKTHTSTSTRHEAKHMPQSYIASNHSCAIGFGSTETM